MNNLQKAINRLIETGKEYNDPGAPAFGDQNGTQFEIEFLPCLKEYGFVRVELPISKAELITILKKPTNTAAWKELEQCFVDTFGDTNVYIPQPAGVGHEPDFLVYCDRKLWPLELKKSESRKPVYGDNGCHPLVIYIFKGKRSKKFGGGLGYTYWYGGDIIDAKTYEAGLAEVAKFKSTIKQLLESAVHVSCTPPRMATNARLGTEVRILEHPKQRDFERSVITLIHGPFHTPGKIVVIKRLHTVTI